MSLEVLNESPNNVPIVLQPGKFVNEKASDKKYTIPKKLKVLDLIATFHYDKNLVEKEKGLYLFAIDKKKMLKNY